MTFTDSDSLVVNHVWKGPQRCVGHDGSCIGLLRYSRYADETRTQTIDIPLVSGVTNNISLLRDIITEKSFVEGDISTKYLPKIYPDGFKGRQLKDQEYATLGSIAACLAVKSALRDGSFKQQSKLTLEKPQTLEVTLNDYKRHVHVRPMEKNGVRHFEVRLLYSFTSTYDCRCRWTSKVNRRSG